MIFPGHVAAPVLASRYLDIDRRLAVLAAVVPDLVDKSAYYVLHISHWTRLPAHAPIVFLALSLAVALAGRLLRGNWRWGIAWLAGYGLHLLCDLIPPDGVLPWAWPWRAYADMASTGLPWFLGGGDVPWVSLTVEVALVAVALAVEIAHWRWRSGLSSRAPR